MTVSIFTGGLFLLGLNAGNKGQERSLDVFRELNRDLRSRIGQLEVITNDLRQENVTLKADRDRFEILNHRMEQQLTNALKYIEELEARGQEMQATIEALRKRVEEG